MSAMLPNGTYHTAAGSTLTVSGEHGGTRELEFDWLEEENACIDCVPEPYEDDEGHLVWHCEVCGRGDAKWIPDV